MDLMNPTQPAPQDPQQPLTANAPTPPPTPIAPSVITPQQAINAQTPQPMPQPTPQQPTWSYTKKKLIPMVAGIIVLLGLAAFLSTLSDSLDKKITDREASTSNTAISPPKTEQENATTAEPVAKQQLAINATISDKELGHTITITEVIINGVTVEEKYKDSQSGKTPITLKVRISTEGKYSGAPNISSLIILGEDGKRTNNSSIFEPAMKTAGLTPLPFTSPTASKPIEGYVTFAVPTEQIGSLTLYYKRFESKILNGSQTLPAKEFTAVLR